MPRQSNILKKSESWDLSALIDYAKIFGVDFELSDDMSMREYKNQLEKRIIEEIHPCQIYDNSKVVPGQWATYLPDPSNPYGRRRLRRNSYEKLCQAIIEYYKDQYHLDMELSMLFDEWAIFRRDETAAKPGTVRKDVSLWRTHIKDVEVDGKKLQEYKVTEITPKLLYSFFRKITKDRTYSRHTVNNIRGVLSGIFA